MELDFVNLSGSEAKGKAMFNEIPANNCPRCGDLNWFFGPTPPTWCCLSCGSMIRYNEGYSQNTSTMPS